MNRIVIAGGSGFLGQTLAQYFRDRGDEVLVLTRRPGRRAAGGGELTWDGCTPGNWAKAVDGAMAVINLAGRSVNCRYTRKNRREIFDSRIDSTRVLGEVMARCATPPRVWINASTATIYRHTYGPAWDESGAIGGTPAVKDEFSVGVATAWEQALWGAPAKLTRKIALRCAMVLGRQGNSVFPVLKRLAWLGLGGRMAGGRQFVSWVHELDFCRAVDWLLRHDDFAGPVNLGSPNPVTNAEMMEAVRALVGRGADLSS
ncbi:MAG TPA: NAD-dependent epimerase/dehydratase family protein, partial [Verrucomicrobiae bacterium]|nr:NAD-dependent epimerase/dehydratase family protein [Verrucomicrobiae bacterium]